MAVKGRLLTRTQWDKGEAKPGDFFFTQRGYPDNSYIFWYNCPCGCNTNCRIVVGENFKPNQPYPTWNWDGNSKEPTLLPSIHYENHWHGWLTGGKWVEC